MKSEYVNAVRLPFTAVFAIVAFSAQAADMYAPGISGKDAPMYEAVPSWTGFYLGVNGGYGWGAKSSTLNTSASGYGDTAAGTASSTIWSEGGFGGGQLGYNAQRDRIVFGIEADIEGAGIGGRAFSEAVSADGTSVVADAWAKSSLDWFGTVRGRVGYSFGSYLLYATGGFAFGGVRDSLSQSVTSVNVATPGTSSASSNTTLTGYVAGGGFETAIAPSWSVRAEYQYIDLGDTRLLTNNNLTYTCDPTCTDNGNASIKIGHSYNTVRVGLNYKINQPYEPLK